MSAGFIRPDAATDGAAEMSDVLDKHWQLVALLNALDHQLTAMHAADGSDEAHRASRVCSEIRDRLATLGERMDTAAERDYAAGCAAMNGLEDRRPAKSAGRISPYAAATARSDEQAARAQVLDEHWQLVALLSALDHQLAAMDAADGSDQTLRASRVCSEIRDRLATLGERLANIPTGKAPGAATRQARGGGASS